MKKLQSLFATCVAAASLAVVPVASAAPTVHFVGAGSSAQYLTSALAADQLAFNNLTGHNTNGSCTFHYTANNAANIIDRRDSPLQRIVPEIANLWVVWVGPQDGASCAASVGTGAPTDIWAMASVDSTVGVRAFLATQRDNTKGDYLQILTGITAGNNVASALWTDNNPDVALNATVASTLGTAGDGSANVQVNAGITDIRPEDALAATTRSIKALDTAAWTGLGYIGPTASIGSPIKSANASSTATANPVKFGIIPGTNDPISGAGKTVRTYTTIPFGAAPIVFAINNGGTANPNLYDLITGVKGDATANGVGYPTSPNNYKLAGLFDGTGACDTSNPAFNPGDATGTPLTLFLREPLSGTMNTTEYTLFRTTGNSKDSQEVGVNDPTRAPFNPLNNPCVISGSRQRAIGTGEVIKGTKSNTVGGLLNTPNSMGYFFFSWGNIAKIQGQAKFQYATLDGVDPIGPTTVSSGQQLPPCITTNCLQTLWVGGVSFPTLRNGSYKAWSLYRWLTPTDLAGETDAFGPAHVAQSSQDLVATSVDDFVPFLTSSGNDGLDVYRSHFTQSGITCAAATNPGCNGVLSTSSGGSTLGGGTEAGGDEGGAIIGWDYATVTTSKGTGSNSSYCKVQWTKGRHFGFSGTNATHAGGQPLLLESSNVTINGSVVTVQGSGSVPPATNPTATTLYVLPACSVTTTGRAFAAQMTATQPGTIAKKQ
jgi:hypothetical protein